MALLTKNIAIAKPPRRKGPRQVEPAPPAMPVVEVGVIEELPSPARIVTALTPKKIARVKRFERRWGGKMMEP